MGPDCQNLEKSLAELTGSSHGIGCASGSDALLLALMAIGVGPGDEVIMPSFTFFATASAVTRLGRFLGGKTTSYVPTGCNKCLRTGYRGRRAIFELLDVNDELRDVILTQPSIQAMKRVIEAGLFTTLAQSGWKLVAQGETSLEEIDRVAGQG